MEKIDNEYLEREFNNNYINHEIFKRQRHSTIDDLIKNIEEKKEILFEININNIMPYYNLRNNFKYDNNDEEKYWNHVISILFMSELKEKYKIDTQHDIDEERRIITRDSFDDYKRKENTFLNRNDLFDIIKYLNNGSGRIHIVLRYVNNEYIWKELKNYLKDDLPFITMIYSDGEIVVSQLNEDNSNDYNCTIFDKYEEGINNNSNNKNKALIYEKKI